MKSLINIKRLPLSVALAILLSTNLAHGQDCYVVSAGIDNYPSANRLMGCLNDARNNTAAFQAQQGLAFGKVQAYTLLDSQATLANISQKFRDVGRQARAGDFVVLFLSGHGNRTNNQTWSFLPYDFDPRNESGTSLTDRHILGAADEMVNQGKKVIVIVDACFAGQLRVAAQTQLNRYRNPQGGGLILMLSSSASQTSAALGQYSAFAKALTDSMNGAGDLNADGKVTLTEIKQHTYDRTYQLLRQKKMNERQDSEVAWSPSISAQLTLGKSQQIAGLQQPIKQRPLDQQPIKQQPVNPFPKKPVSTRPLVNDDALPVIVQAMVWNGSEDLKGYGKLTFQLHAGGRAIMYDAKGTAAGTWEKDGTAMTMRFHGGRVTYAGVVSGSSMQGMADNGKTSWAFRVQSQNVIRGMTEPIR